MSPLSDTTNLAPAMAGTDLFTHIRYMTITTVPAMIVTLIIFLIIGFTYKFESTPGDIETGTSIHRIQIQDHPLAHAGSSFPDLHHCKKDPSPACPAGRFTDGRDLCHHFPAAPGTRGGTGTGQHHHLLFQGILYLCDAIHLRGYCHHHLQ